MRIRIYSPFRLEGHEEDNVLEESLTVKQIIASAELLEKLNDEGLEVVSILEMI